MVYSHRSGGSVHDALLIPWLTLAADGLARWAATRQQSGAAIHRLAITAVLGES